MSSCRVSIAHGFANLLKVSKNVYPMKLLKPGQHSSRSSRKRSAPPKASETSSKPGDDKPSAKQRRRTQPAKRPPTQISCQACGGTGVPLIHGGRKYSIWLLRNDIFICFEGFCRPCVDSGRDKIGEMQGASNTPVPVPAPAPAGPAKPPVFIHSAYSTPPQSTPVLQPTNQVAQDSK